jgi:hypothetical protein
MLSLAAPALKDVHGKQDMDLELLDYPALQEKQFWALVQPKRVITAKIALLVLMYIIGKLVLIIYITHVLWTNKMDLELLN